jgi:hypothetical protein
MKRYVYTAAAPSLKKNCQLSQFPECLPGPQGKPAAGGMKAAAAHPAENAARNSSAQSGKRLVSSLKTGGPGFCLQAPVFRGSAKNEGTDNHFMRKLRFIPTAGAG